MRLFDEFTVRGLPDRDALEAQATAHLGWVPDFVHHPCQLRAEIKRGGMVCSFTLEVSAAGSVFTAQVLANGAQQAIQRMNQRFRAWYQAWLENPTAASSVSASLPLPA